MKKFFLPMAFCCANLLATKVDDTLVTNCDCTNAMRLCALCSASTSVAGGGAYVGGILADSGLVSTAVVVHGGAAVMCCGLLGALIGASCPLDENDKADSSGKNNSGEVKPLATSMEYSVLLTKADSLNNNNDCNLLYDSEAGAVIIVTPMESSTLPHAVVIEKSPQTK